MRRLTVFYNHPDMKHLPAETVVMTNTETQFALVMQDKDLRLGIGQYDNSATFPTAIRVETYTKLADLYEQYDNELVNDQSYVFIQSWTPTKSREQAIVDYYRSVSAEVQKDFINSRMVDI